MNARQSILVLLALFAPTLTSAQTKTSSDLDTLLRDSSYVFNRFEEMSGGIAAQIETNYPVEVRKGSKDALSAIMKNVETEKPSLNALLGHTKVSSVDLLDVYTELVEIASELSSESSTPWADQKLGMDMTQLNAKVAVLGAKLAGALRSQIAAEQLQLASCMRNTPSHK
jgi:hypothetical protein